MAFDDGGAAADGEGSDGSDEDCELHPDARTQSYGDSKGVDDDLRTVRSK